MNIKICPADKFFSYFIRLRDRRCVRCGSPVELNDQGLPKSHNCSHYHGRGHEGTRFDPLNADTLCFGCHRIWESDGRDEYTAFKKKQLGENEFKILDFKAHSYCKKDRKLSLIIAKELLASVIRP